MKPVRYLAPSDLSFLYDRCPRCFWLKLQGIMQPREVLPGIFREIDRAQKSGISIDVLRKLGIPAVNFLKGERVCSMPDEFGGTMLAVRGFTDRRVRLEDGSIAVLDFKTSNPRQENRAKYWRAMAAYQYAIEQGEEPEEVSLLSLIVFSPYSFRVKPDDPTRAYYTGDLQRLDLDMDRVKFQAVLTKVGEALASDDIPGRGQCDVCALIESTARQMVKSGWIKVDHLEAHSA